LAYNFEEYFARKKGRALAKNNSNWKG
jgi:hypothetical protein